MQDLSAQRRRLPFLQKRWRRLRTRCVVLSSVFSIFWALTMAVAVVPLEEQLASPVLEARAHALGQQIRCVTCAGQTINDSHAPLAEALRRTVREQLQQGAADAEILAYIRERYGDDVLQTPPIAPRTVALWGIPLVFLSIGMVAAYVYSRQRKRTSDTTSP